MKKTLYIGYYSLLGSLVLGLVIYTLFQTSLAVAHGREQQQLGQQQIQLVKRQQQLQTSLAQKKSLMAFLENSQLKNYHLITQPIIIKTSQSLAALN